MIRRLSEQLLLGPEDVKPSQEDFSVIGVFNPGVVRLRNNIVLLVRVAEKPLESRVGYIGLPRRDLDNNTVVDWVPEDEWDQTDRRFVRRKTDHRLRLTSISHLRVFRNGDHGSSRWVSGPLLLPESRWEEYGMEDARITEIDGTYRITYVAVSRHGASTALASSNDMLAFERNGVIFCPENKDVVLFPQQEKGQYLSLHRPNPNSQFSPPQIWLARSPDLLHWGQHECLYGGAAAWELDRVGPGAPPLQLEEGWLEIYHGSQRTERVGDVGAYAAGALLLDHHNPARILRRSHEPIIEPTAKFEQSGFVNNIIFPTALIEQDDNLSMYYGAADTYTGVVQFSRKELLASLYRTE